MGRIVVVAYKPKPGKDDALRAAVARHVAVLRAEALVTKRAPIVMRAADGTILEVFEWMSPAAIERAHQTPSVQALWAQFADACDYIPLAQVPEGQQMFAEFDAIEP